MTNDDRLTALERRMTELEARVPPPGSRAAELAPAPDSEVFWALQGLRDRVEAPGAVMLVGQVSTPDGREAQWQEGAAVGDLLADDWADAVEVLAALGHPVRLRLLHRVLSGAATVNELMATDGVGTSGQVYHHLRQLVAAGWLRAVGGGRYEVPVARVVPLLTTIVGARR
ncbi:ArsR/SmtB family transcription factor [Georgenia sunbinii]|uniref:ArsR/SmtB family transcription factor n=1 Tax=Georgenia sunbinii TaxID=3117728 RepID=UPI002F26AC14